MEEARLERTETGLVPRGQGWFIANIRELSWRRLPENGIWCEFDDPDDRSPQLGIGVHVLAPGQASAMYHSENEDEEGFLILDGEWEAAQDDPLRHVRMMHEAGWHDILSPSSLDALPTIWESHFGGR